MPSGDSIQKESDSSTAGANLETAQLFAAKVAKAASHPAREPAVQAQCSEPPPQLPDHNGVSDNGVAELASPAEPLSEDQVSVSASAVPQTQQQQQQQPQQQQETFPSEPESSRDGSASSGRQQGSQQKKRSAKQKMRELSQRAENRVSGGDMEAFIDTERSSPLPATSTTPVAADDVTAVTDRSEKADLDTPAAVSPADLVTVSSGEREDASADKPAVDTAAASQPCEQVQRAEEAVVETAQQPAAQPVSTPPISDCNSSTQPPATPEPRVAEEPQEVSTVNGGGEEVETSEPRVSSAVHRVLDELRSAGESRKHYDREALLKLQQHPLSQKRPVDFPDLNVVRHQGQGSRALVERSRSIGPMTGFMDSRSHTHQKLRLRASQGRRDVAGQPHHMLPPRRTEIVLNREVKLQSTENAWKRATDKADDSTTILRTFRGTLNKLTPSNATRLIESIVKMSTDFKTCQLVTDVIEVLFDKALSEPAYAELYARVCSSIWKTEVERPNEQGVVVTVGLRKILVERCQREFEQDNRGKLNKEARLEQIEAEPDANIRRQKKDELDEESRKIRLRSNGNIRFIGELFKLGLLNAQVMHKCISKLFTDRHEDSYECMCKLLSTIGAKLERNQSLSSQFADIRKLTKQRDISSRIRFMMEDLIELRDNEWVSSRVGDTARPVTIDEIHEQARQEEVTQRQRLAMADDRRLPPPSRSSLGGVDRRRAQMSSLPSRQPTLANLSALSRMKQSGHSLKLGPGGAGSGWSSGSKGAKAASVRPAAASTSTFEMTNKFHMLSSDDGEEARPIPQPRSTPAPAASSSGPPVVSSFQQQRLSGATDPTADQMNAIVKCVVGDLLNHKNFNEAVNNCQQYLHESTVVSFISKCIDVFVDASSDKRHMAGELHRVLLERQLVTVQQYTQALSDTLEFISDLECDVPTLWKNLAELLTPPLLAQSVNQPAVFTLPQLGGCVEHVRTAGRGPTMIRELFRRVVDLKGHDVLRTVVPAKFDWSLFFTANDDHVKLLSEWQMGFLAPHELQPLPISFIGETREQLSRLVEAARTHGGGLSDWLKSERLLPAASPEEHMKLASDLLAAVCFNSVMASEGGQSVCEKRLEQFTDLMKSVIGDDVKRELACLEQLVLLWVHLNYPPLLLDRWFRVLSDSDVISDAAFLEWNANPTNCEGVGSAIASTTGFFDELIRVADEEQT